MASSDSRLQPFSGRWFVRVLGLLHEQRGARFVVMKNGLGVPADSLSRCLKQLMAAGWVQRNPGYGHPLRPEYILTPAGAPIAVRCWEFDETVRALDLTGTVFRKWTVPALIAISRGAVRFNDLKSALDVTPRALTQALGRLTCAKLVLADGGYRTTCAGRRVAGLALSIERAATPSWQRPC